MLRVSAPKFRLLPLPTLGLIVMAALLSACSTTSSPQPMSTKEPLRSVSHVDLPRYMGDWRVIANIPYFAEKGCVDSIESYALNPDGTIKNWFTYRKKSFSAPQKRMNARAVVVNHETNAEWRVKFLGGLISAKYFVIDVDPHYQWAIIGHPSRKYGWILARTKTIPDSLYQELLKKTERNGYNPAQFQKVPQTPEQLSPTP